MKLIDLSLLLITIGTALYLAIEPARSRTKQVLTVLISALAAAQLLLEGYYWQFIPLYFLVLAIVITTFLLKPGQGKIQKRIIRFGLSLMIILSLAPWCVFLLVPTLTEPRGNYHVGTRIFRWVDPNRGEPITPEPDDKRNVIVQAWYPAEPNTQGIHSTYIDGLHQLPEMVGFLPNFIFDHYDEVDTHGILDAPISKEKEKWPVVLFLTGNSAARAFYTSLVADLASHGYVVLAIDHPYEAMITQLADGSVITPREVHPQGAPNLLNFMKDRLDLRIADMAFVIDEFILRRDADPFFSSLDANRIMATGHSLGGATAAVAMARDPRIQAAVNIDGTLYGELPPTVGVRPFMLIESNKGDSTRYARYEAGNQDLFRHFEGGYRYEISEADHYSFTDAPLLLALPTRFLAGSILGFGNIPSTTHHATVDLLTTFFDGTVNGDFSGLDSAAERYAGVIRKTVK